MPFPFHAVSESLWNFAQVTDREVLTLLGTPTVAGTAGDAKAFEFSSAAALRAAALDAPHGVPSLNVLLDLVDDARIVVIGESSHGTHEFYAARAEITKRLIEEKGFSAVAAEADWSDAYRVTRYVRGMVPTRPQKKHCADSRGSRPGCGGTPRYGTSSDG